IVLVTGGEDARVGPLNTSELYDPSTNMWTTDSSMHFGRFFHTASVLINGNVLVAGGVSDEYHIANTAEFYNPSTENYMPIDKTKNLPSS
ncbi:unnamed protein product, partial [Rotaria magnacalcarata]